MRTSDDTEETAGPISNTIEVWIVLALVLLMALAAQWSPHSDMAEPSSASVFSSLSSLQ